MTARMDTSTTIKLSQDNKKQQQQDADAADADDAAAATIYIPLPLTETSIKLTNTSLPQDQTIIKEFLQQEGVQPALYLEVAKLYLFYQHQLASDNSDSSSLKFNSTTRQSYTNQTANSLALQQQRPTSLAVFQDIINSVLLAGARSYYTGPFYARQRNKIINSICALQLERIPLNFHKKPTNDAAAGSKSSVNDGNSISNSNVPELSLMDSQVLTRTINYLESAQEGTDDSTSTLNGHQKTPATNTSDDGYTYENFVIKGLIEFSIHAHLTKTEQQINNAISKDVKLRNLMPLLMKALIHFHQSEYMTSLQYYEFVFRNLNVDMKQFKQVHLIILKGLMYNYIELNDFDLTQSICDYAIANQAETKTSADNQSDDADDQYDTHRAFKRQKLNWDKLNRFDQNSKHHTSSDATTNVDPSEIVDFYYIKGILCLRTLNQSNIPHHLRSPINTNDDDKNNQAAKTKATIQRALDYFIFAYNLNPQHVPTLIQLSYHYMNCKHLTQAQHLIDSAWSQLSKCTVTLKYSLLVKGEIAFQMARLAHIKQQFDTAHKYYQDAYNLIIVQHNKSTGHIKWTTMHYQLLYYLSQTCVHKNLFTQAADYLAILHGWFPNHHSICKMYGYVCLRLCKFQQAFLLLSVATDQSPNDLCLLFQLVEVAQATNNDESNYKAYNAYKRIIKLLTQQHKQDTTAAEGTHNADGIDNSQQKTKSAVSSFMSFEDITSADVPIEVYNNFVVCASRCGKLDLHVHFNFILESQVEIADKDITNHNVKVETDGTGPDTKQQQPNLNLKPITYSNLTSVYNYALALSSNDYIAEAINILNQVLDFCPDSVDARLQLQVLTIAENDDEATVDTVIETLEQMLNHLSDENDDGINASKALETKIRIYSILAHIQYEIKHDLVKSDKCNQRIFKLIIPTKDKNKDSDGITSQEKAAADVKIKDPRQKAAAAAATTTATDANKFNATKRIAIAILDFDDNYTKIASGNNMFMQGQEAMVKWSHMLNVSAGIKKHQDSIKSASSYFHRAQNWYRSILDKDGHNVFAAHGLATCLANQGQVLHAKNMLQDICHQLDENENTQHALNLRIDAKINLAQISIQQGQSQTANKYFKEIIDILKSIYNKQVKPSKRLKSKIFYLYLSIANTYYNSDDMEACIDTCCEALQFSPKHPVFIYNLALAREEHAIKILQNSNFKTVEMVTQAITLLNQACDDYLSLVDMSIIATELSMDMPEIPQGQLERITDKSKAHYDFLQASQQHAQDHLQATKREQDKLQALKERTQQHTKELQEKMFKKQQAELEQAEKKKAEEEARAQEAKLKLEKMQEQWQTQFEEQRQRKRKRQTDRDFDDFIIPTDEEPL